MTPDDFLKKWIPNDGGFCSFCEILLHRCPESGRFMAQHVADRNSTNKLTRLTTVEEVLKWSETTNSGENRPLKTAPDLKSGWVISETSIEMFVKKIDALYPNVLQDTVDYYTATNTPLDFRSLIASMENCTGFANQVTDAQINKVMRDQCFRGCLRRIAWGIDNKCPVSKLPPPQSAIPAVCNRACEFALEATKQLID